MFRALTTWLAGHQFMATRADLYDDMAEAMDDKETPYDFLLVRRGRALEKGLPIAEVFSSILKRMGTGSLSKGLAGVAPASDRMMLAAFEQTGDLPRGLRFLASSTRALATMKGAIVSAVAMPVGLCVILVGIMYGFATGLVPILVQIVKIDRWPASGRIAYALSTFVGDYILLIVGGGILVSGAFVWSLSRWTGAWREMVDRHVIPYRIYRDFNGALFLVSLAGLMQSGQGPKESLQMLRSGATPWMRWRISKILKRLDANPGEQGRALNSGFFSDLMGWRIEDFFRRSTPERAIGKVGLSAVEVTTKSVMAGAKKLNFALLIVAGALMALMIVAPLQISQEASKEVRQVSGRR